VAQVVVEAEARIVNPDGMTLERDPAQLLAQARDLVELRLDAPADRLDVDPAVGPQQGSGVEDRRARAVREGVRRVEDQERVVLRREPLVAGAGHR
jgi:hypothetical protein